MAQQFNSSQDIWSPVRMSISQTPDLNAEDSKKLTPIYQSLQAIIAGMRDYAGVGTWSQSTLAGFSIGTISKGMGIANRELIVASEAITQGMMVGLTSGGLLQKAGQGVPAIGMLVGPSVSAGGKGEVRIGFGMLSGLLAGLTPGTRYVLGPARNGVLSSYGNLGSFPASAPWSQLDSAGNPTWRYQPIGYAVSTTDFVMMIGALV